MKQNKFVYGGIALSFLGISLFFQNCSKTQFSHAPIVEASKVIYPLCREMESSALKPKLILDWNSLKLKDGNEEYNQVMASPVIGQLDNDIQSEIVFTSFTGAAYNSEGVLRVIDGVTGETQFTVAGENAPYGYATPLIADLDADGYNEIIYIHKSLKSVIALNHNGTQRWAFAIPGNRLVSSASFLSTSDLNKNGKAEVLLGSYVIEEVGEKAPGVILTLLPEPASGAVARTFAASLDPAKPNEMFLINSGTGKIYDSKGQLVSQVGAGYIAVADVDQTVPGMEIARIYGGHISLYNGLTGALLKDRDMDQDQPLKCGKGIGGGAPTIGNFDGNSANTEIAVATGRYLSVYDERLNLVSQIETQDCSSLVTGITSFDFNGDKKPEIIYSDEEYLRIYEVDQNRQLKMAHKIINPTGTLYEYPIIADTTGDGSAELVVVSNNYAASIFYKDANETSDAEAAKKVTGLRVFSSSEMNAWMPTSATWNQYEFNVSMLNSNGSLKSTTDTRGTLSHMFRVNKNLYNPDRGCTPASEFIK